MPQRHTLRLVEPSVHKHDVIICHINFLLQMFMSDLGICKPLRGSNYGVCAEISTYPACLLAILLSLAREAQRDKETCQFILVRATVVV